MGHHTEISFMLTDHAMVRARQRGFKIEDLEIVVQHGEPVYDHRGGQIWTLDKKWVSKLRNILPKATAARLDHFADAYVVQAMDGAIVTVGHRYKRLPSRG